MPNRPAARGVCVAAAIVLLLPRALHAQEKPGFAQKPTASSEEQLSDAAQRMEHSIVIVGDENAGHGTAWVISKEHRLLATNSHVADMFHMNDKEMYAVCNGRSERFVVERAWWHPGVTRLLEGTVLVRSQDPADGDTYVYSPDVAVLQLKESEHELPEAFELATREELARLLGKPIAIMGFPGHDTKDFPPESSIPAATYHSGVISRQTDFQFAVTEDAKERQMLQHTAYTWQGFSGSPMFLANGHVIGLHNSSRQEEYPTSAMIRAFSHGVRVDALWELLVHHRLADKVGLSPEQREVSVERYLGPPSDVENAVREAIAWVEEAGDLSDHNKFLEASQLCNKAIKAVPTYADAYLTRLAIYLTYISQTWDTLSRESFDEYMGYAKKDIEKLRELTPSNAYVPLAMAVILNRQALADEDNELLQKADDILTELRKIADDVPVATVDEYWHATLFGESATSRWELDAPEEEVIELATKCVEAAPKWSATYEYRAPLLEDFGREAEARRDWAMFEALRSGGPLPPQPPEE